MTKAFLKYLIMDCIIPYNVVLGRPAINDIGEVVSSMHLKINIKHPMEKFACWRENKRWRRHAQMSVNKGMCNGAPWRVKKDQRTPKSWRTLGYLTDGDIMKRSEKTAM